MMTNGSEGLERKIGDGVGLRVGRRRVMWDQSPKTSNANLLL